MVEFFAIMRIYRKFVETKMESVAENCEGEMYSFSPRVSSERGECVSLPEFYANLFVAATLDSFD
jgi:hypothetical protein